MPASHPGKLRMASARTDHSVAAMSSPDVLPPIAAPAREHEWLVARERELARRARSCQEAMDAVRHRIAVASDRGPAGAPRAAEALARLGRDLVGVRRDLALVRRALRAFDGELRVAQR